jgi:hypothetical protein
MLRKIRDWFDRLLLPALLVAVAQIELSNGDHRAAIAFSGRFLERDLAEARDQRHEDTLFERFDDAVRLLQGAQQALWTVSIRMMLTFLVFSVAWLLLSRERLKFRVMTFFVVWLTTLATPLFFYPIY